MTGKNIRKGILLYMPKLYDIFDGTWTRDIPRYRNLDKETQIKLDQKIYSEYLAFAKRTFVGVYPENEKPRLLINNKKILFTIWYQAEQPKVIQEAIKTQKKFSNNYEHIIITKDNLKEYVTPYLKIEKRFLSGQLDLVHYCEYLKILLLSKYNCVVLNPATVLLRPFGMAILDIKDFVCADSYWLEDIRFKSVATHWFLGGNSGYVYQYAKQLYERYFETKLYVVSNNFLNFIFEHIFDIDKKAQKQYGLLESKIDILAAYGTRELKTSRIFNNLLQTTCGVLIGDYNMKNYNENTMIAQIINHVLKGE